MPACLPACLHGGTSHSTSSEPGAICSHRLVGLRGGGERNPGYIHARVREKTDVFPARKGDEELLAAKVCGGGSEIHSPKRATGPFPFFFPGKKCPRRCPPQLTQTLTQLLLPSTRLYRIWTADVTLLSSKTSERILRLRALRRPAMMAMGEHRRLVPVYSAEEGPGHRQRERAATMPERGYHHENAIRGAILKEGRVGTVRMSGLTWEQKQVLFFSGPRVRKACFSPDAKKGHGRPPLQAPRI